DLVAQHAAALVVAPVLTGSPALRAADGADRGNERLVDVAGLGEDPRDRPVQREQPLVTPEPALALVERSPQAFQLVRRLHLRDGSFHSHSPPPGTAGSCYGARRAFAASQIPRG